MPASTVTLDRQIVVDLLVEAEAVAHALGWIGGCAPSPLVEELERRASAVADQAVAPWPADESGPRWDLHEAGFVRGRELLAEILPEGGGVDAS